MMYDVRCMMYV